MVGEFIHFEEIGGICNMHHWLGMDAPDDKRYDCLNVLWQKELKMSLNRTNVQVYVIWVHLKENSRYSVLLLYSH